MTVSLWNKGEIEERKTLFPCKQWKKFSLSALSYLASSRKGNILTPGDTMFFLAESLIGFSTGGLANLSLLKMDFEYLAYFHLHKKLQ